MSFQGPGTGLTGTASSLTSGAAQVATTSQTLQLTSASSSTWGWQGQNTTPSWLWGSNQGNVNTVFAPGNLSVGYAGNAGYAGSAGYAGYAGSAGNINGYAPAAGNATYAQSAGSAGYAQTAGYANNLAVQGIGSSTWAWAGQPGNPGHYWGSNQGGYHAVWQLNQGYVGYAGSAGNINGYAPLAGNIYGYAPVAGNAQQGGNYPIWITGGSNIYAVMGPSGGYSQMFNNGVNYILGSQAAAYQGTLSGYFAYSVYSGGRYFIASDKRIKKRVTNEEEKPQYLETVNKLGVERFTYIDTVKNGESIVTGFFAQDVESVIPDAVKKNPDFLPSVMKKASKVDGLRITCDNHGFIKDDRIKLHIDKGEGAVGIYAVVTSVIDDNTFEVNNNEVREPLFIYGKLADDFSTVDENKILPHTVGAIQELHLIIKGLEKRIENLESLVVK